MFVLFILHHVLNNKWCRNLFKRKYTPFRIWQTTLVFLVLISMIGSMISGIILSRYAFDFLPITGGNSWARTLHMLSAYWGFVLLSLHLGIHWNMMIEMARRMIKKPSSIRFWLVRSLGIVIAGYGVVAFIKREIGSYMILQNQFVFFDFEEPLIIFLFDYIAVMGLFVFVSYYLTQWVKRMVS